uniref:C2H2-type domain-containing protein n=1 Tax=Caenorhabditis japonica TaxID=281687 RepID=A0A8R1DFZ2_CAEJA
MSEQQELAEKLEKVQETQRNFNSSVKDRLSKCRCGVEHHVKHMLAKEINVNDLKREDGTDFSIKIPCPSTFPVYFDPNFLNLEAEAHQQKIDLELLKMMESVSHPFSEMSTSAMTPEDNGGGGGGPMNIPFFVESPDNKRKGSSSKTARKRSAPNDMQIGPFPCHHCDKTFRQKHGLSQHLLTHESNGAFECDGCGKRYSRQESVYRHQRSTQCTKYQTLTNVRHDGVAGPSMAPDHTKPLHLNPQSAFLL